VIYVIHPVINVLHLQIYSVFNVLMVIIRRFTRIVVNNVFRVILFAHNVLEKVNSIVQHVNPSQFYTVKVALKNVRNFLKNSLIHIISNAGLAIQSVNLVQVLHNLSVYNALMDISSLILYAKIVFLHVCIVMGLRIINVTLVLQASI